MKKLFLVLLLILTIPLVLSIDFVPSGNMVGKNVYSIQNFTRICFNESCVTNWSQITGASYTGDTTWIFLTGSQFFFNATRMNLTIDNRVSNLITNVSLVDAKVNAVNSTVIGQATAISGVNTTTNANTASISSLASNDTSLGTRITSVNSTVFSNNQSLQSEITRATNTEASLATNQSYLQSVSGGGWINGTANTTTYLNALVNADNSNFTNPRRLGFSNVSENESTVLLLDVNTGWVNFYGYASELFAYNPIILSGNRRNSTIPSNYSIFGTSSYPGVVILSDASMSSALQVIGLTNTSQLIVNGATAVACDLKAYTNGTVYCGTDLNTGGVSGSGVAGYNAVWSNSSNLINGSIYENSTNIDIGTGAVKIGYFTNDTNKVGIGTDYVGGFSFKANVTAPYLFGYPQNITENSTFLTYNLATGNIGFAESLLNTTITALAGSSIGVVNGSINAVINVTRGQNYSMSRQNSQNGTYFGSYNGTSTTVPMLNLTNTKITINHTTTQAILIQLNIRSNHSSNNYGDYGESNKWRCGANGNNYECTFRNGTSGTRGNSNQTNLGYQCIVNVLSGQISNLSRSNATNAYSIIDSDSIAVLGPLQNTSNQVQIGGNTPISSTVNYSNRNEDIYRVIHWIGTIPTDAQLAQECARSPNEVTNLTNGLVAEWLLNRTEPAFSNNLSVYDVSYVSTLEYKHDLTDTSNIGIIASTPAMNTQNLTVSGSLYLTGSFVWANGSTGNMQQCKLSAGSCTITSTRVTAGSKIDCYPDVLGTITVGTTYTVGTIIAGTSYVVTGGATDTSTVSCYHKQFINVP